MAKATAVRIVRVSELVAFLVWNENDRSAPISARMIFTGWVGCQFARREDPFSIISFAIFQLVISAAIGLITNNPSNGAANDELDL